MHKIGETVCNVQSVFLLEPRTERACNLMRIHKKSFERLPDLLRDRAASVTEKQGAQQT
jgi:hypothetical protein